MGKNNIGQAASNLLYFPYVIHPLDKVTSNTAKQLYDLYNQAYITMTYQPVTYLYTFTTTFQRGGIIKPKQ